MEHYLTTNKFYILSGPSGNGKSSLVKQLLQQGLPQEAVISSDIVTQRLFGDFRVHEGDDTVHTELIGWEINRDLNFKVIFNMLEARLQQKLPTIYDATNLTDSIRKECANMAQKYGVQTEVIIFDVPKELAFERLLKRENRFIKEDTMKILDKQYENFMLTSELPYIIAKPDDIFVYTLPLLKNSNIDLVGDTHGLLDDTILLLEKNGWNYNEKEKFFTHSDPTKQVLFLGDAIDRGPQSLELLNVIKNTVKNKQGLFIIGNHEAKLMRFYENYYNNNSIIDASIASSETFLNFLRLPIKEQQSLYSFIFHSPSHYALWIDKEKNIPTDNPENAFKLAFIHANNVFYDPYRITRSHCLYGKKINTTLDLDDIYENNYKAGLNEYVCFHGHVKAISQQNHVFSLEEEQAFSGNLVLLPLQKYLQDLQANQWNSSYSFFEKNKISQKTQFNFKEKNKDKVFLIKKLTELMNKGLVVNGCVFKKNAPQNNYLDGFKIFKYTKRVFFDKLWDTDPLLNKTRGLGLDFANNIIVHPFDKIYNYGECNAGEHVKETDLVQVVEKMNGFLGCISKHPFKEELLLSTTGSYTSPFVQYIADFIDQQTKDKLLTYFKTHSQTLMFEVIHPDDKHIIDYSENQQGLWLIGARGLDFNSSLVSEKELDDIAQNLSFKRPQWKECAFKEVLEQLPSSCLEGYVIRDHKTHEPIMKIKTNYYLVTKFIGRMGERMIYFMFKNPEKFKEQHMEEEFFPIVDSIIKMTTMEKFKEMGKQNKIDFVRNIIDEQRNSFTVKSQETMKLKKGCS